MEARYLIILSVLFYSCASWHCKKCFDGAQVKRDTLVVTRDVITERVKLDTVVEVKTDTVTIREKNLVIRYKKLAGDTIFLAGSCEPDTLKVEIRVPVETKVETGLALWKVGGLIVLALVVGAGISRL